MSLPIFTRGNMSKKTKDQDSALLEAAVLQGHHVPEALPKPFDFESFKFEKREDFDVYNAEVRKYNRLCIHERNKMKIKVPDESFYKKFKTKFHRFQQAENILKVRIRNKDIDWKGQLKSGGTYMLPMPVIQFLNKLATPEFAEVKTEHGSAVHTETKQVGETPRFSCNILEFAS
jgi:hypothetical protein